MIKQLEKEIKMEDSLQIIWDVLHSYREDCIPEGDLFYDEQWDQICTAMAHIHEALNERTQSNGT